VVDKATGTGVTFMVVEVEESGSPTVGAGDGEVTRVDYDYVFEGITRRTGGLKELTMSSMGVATSLARVGQALKSTYRLTYATIPDLKERKLEVQVARPGVKVRIAPVRH
jgi:hypothetical protein